MRNIALRRGQRRFRENLLSVYGRQCCVTGTGSEAVLEAAHIQPYSSEGTDELRNGLLLRSDIHVFFDLNLLSIDPATEKDFCSKQIRRVPPYDQLHGKKASFPRGIERRPDFDTLKAHFDGTRD